MKKIVLIVQLMSAAGLCALSSTMNHRLMTTAPLLYKQIDYTHKNLSIEFEPIVAGSFSPEHTIANITPNGSWHLSLNQQGLGDINPAWLFLGSKNGLIDYDSTLVLTPTQQQYGLLFHTYKQFEYAFFDVRTSLIQSKSSINLHEIGGGNGGLVNYDGVVITDALQAFTQNDFEYGKIGVAPEVIGFENIQVMFGASGKIGTLKEDTIPLLAGFILFEVPTGAGTTAEYLGQAQVGTNHWGFGFGFDCMIAQDNEFSIVLGGNYRHFIGNWETRSFDLTENGPWSRYLLVEPLDNFTNIIAPSVIGYPAINILTQQAFINGRNEINVYARLEKKFQGCLFELSYDFFYNQAESIEKVNAIPSGYGIYALNTAGGITTSSSAKINEYPTIDQQDYYPVQLVTSDLNLASGAAGLWMSNTIAARLQRVQSWYTYGIGGSVDCAMSAQAISNWSVWANFEILLP